MKIRDLQYLVAVYDLKSFSKAAQACFVSQPTLSGQLRKLEQELGVVLMERSTRKVLFTEVGERVVSEARDMLAGVERIKSLVTEFDDPLVGEFHLGLIPTVGPFLLPLITADLQQQFPAMRLFLHELQTEALIEQLLAGNIDAGIVAKLDWDYPLVEWTLFNEPLVLAVPEKHHLARAKSPVSRTVLDGQTLLMLEDGHCLRDQALGICFAENANEDEQYQATSMNTLLHMIAAGHGMTLVPALATNQPLEGVSYHRFKASEPKREIILVGRKQGARLAGLEKIARFIHEKMMLQPPYSLL